jgi:O-antigen/teichoic acid export membrane protein
MTFTISYKFPKDNYLYLIVLVTIPVNLLFVLLSDFFNIKNDLKLFSLLNITKVLFSLIFIIFIFTINFKYTNGTVYLWIVQLVGFIISIILFLPKYKILYPTIYKISYLNFIKKYLKYAFPLIFLAFWSWINNYFDRFAIEYYMDVNSVGIYNASYSVGSKFFLLLNPFFLTLLTPIVYKNISISTKKKSIKKYSKLYLLISIPILIIIYFTSNYIGLILLSKKYESGFYLIFWVALAYFFMTIVYLYETIFYAEGKTKIILYSNVLSAILNIALNVILIPIYGLVGAFLATLFSFLIRFLIIILYFRRL